MRILVISEIIISLGQTVYFHLNAEEALFHFLPVFQFVYCMLSVPSIPGISAQKNSFHSFYNDAKQMINSYNWNFV